jgi:alkaline phosphatase D
MRSGACVARLGLLAALVVALGSTTNQAAAGNPPPVAFPHGVAVGDVTDDGAVFWTGVDQPADLTLEVAKDREFRPPVKTVTIAATAASDFTAKVPLDELEPEQVYYYRFRSGPRTSDVGTFTTAPAPDRAPGFRFAWTADSDGTRTNGAPAWNSFQTFDRVRSEQPDFFIYLGDTVYADSIRRGTGPATTLDEYRETYKVNRGYAALRHLLAEVSTYATLDDHEVFDDFAGQTVDRARYAAGRRAFLEYLPTRDVQSTGDSFCAGPPLFKVFHRGKDVDLIFLDERSCRSPQVDNVRQPNPATCNGDFAPTLPPPIRAQAVAFFPNPPSPACLAAINDPSRTLLGTRQKELFKQALKESKARFKFVISQGTIQQTYINPYDRWEGYAAERVEILRFIRDNNIKNVVFLSADDHLNLINEVFVDRITEPTPIAIELVTGPVAYLTDQAILETFLGPAAPEGIAFRQGVLSFVGADCRHLDKYSYGVVEVNASAGTAAITLKDDTGAVIKDQVNPSISCTRTLGP